MEELQPLTICYFELKLKYKVFNYLPHVWICTKTNHRQITSTSLWRDNLLSAGP